MSCHSETVKLCSAFSPSPLAVTHAQSFMMTSISTRSKHYKKRVVLLALLATLSLSMTLGLLSLTQEVSQLGWDTFYTAIAMPEWTTVDKKRLLCAVKLWITGGIVWATAI